MKMFTQLINEIIEKTSSKLLQYSLVSQNTDSLKSIIKVVVAANTKPNLSKLTTVNIHNS